MTLINRIKNTYWALTGRYVTVTDRGFLAMLGGDYNTPRRAMAETTYFTCIKVLSEAMGKMPLKLYQKIDDGVQRPPMTDTAYLLAIRPNPYMTATSFWTLMEMCCQHYGNSFAYIDGEFTRSGRYGGSYKIRGFYPMHPDNVSVVIDDAGIFGTVGCLYYEYRNPDTNNIEIFRDSEVLHFKTWYSDDGIIGQPVRNILKATIAGSSAAAECENELYKNSMHASMVMQYTGSWTMTEWLRFRKNLQID